MVKCHCRYIVQLFGQPLKQNCRDVDGDYYHYGSDGDGDGDGDGDDGGDGGDGEVKGIGILGMTVVMQKGSETALLIPRLQANSHRTRNHCLLTFALTTLFPPW